MMGKKYDLLGLSMKKYKNYIALFYVLAVFFIIPIYNRGSYDNISVHKTDAFLFLCGIGLVSYVITSVIDDVKKRDEENVRKKRLSKTDISMLIFGGVILVSAVLSNSLKESIYGVPGFGMGALALCLMILSFFYVSRYFVYSKWIIHTIVASSAIPTILAIINRMGADPLKMQDGAGEAGHSLYVSTFGNYGWYCEYMSVIIPIAIYMLFTTKDMVERTLYGIYVGIIEFAMLMCGTAMIWVASAVAFLFVLKRKLKPDKKLITAKQVPLVIGGVVLLYVIFVLVAARNPNFANGRGYIWRLSFDLYGSLPFDEKLIGVGPNRFMYALNDYLAQRPDAAAEFQARFNDLALTSAHSEYLDYLICTGLLGLAAYLYMIYRVVERYIQVGVGKKDREIAFVAALSYMVYSLGNFSMVCATPMFFIFLGMVAKERR